MSTPPPEEERFITNVLDLTALIHELATICWNAGRKDINPTLVMFAENYLKNYDPVELIDTFIKYSYKHWEEIRLHDQEFFIENAHKIFSKLPVGSDKINAFKLFFTARDQNNEYIIEEEDRESIWFYFESLVKICIKYIHRVREVTLIRTEKGLEPRYTKKMYREIDVKKASRRWKIELPLPVM